MKRSDFFTKEHDILHITSNAPTYPLSALNKTELLLRPLSHNNLNTVLNGTLFSGNGYEPLNIYLRLQLQDGINEDLLLTPQPVIRHNLDYYEMVRRGRRLQEILNYWLKEIEATAKTAAQPRQHSSFLFQPAKAQISKMKERMSCIRFFQPYSGF